MRESSTFWGSLLDLWYDEDGKGGIFKAIAPILGGIAGNLLLPGIGTALGVDLGSFGGIAGAALGAGGGEAAAGGNVGQDLLAGATAGAGDALLGGSTSDIISSLFTGGGDAAAGSDVAINPNTFSPADAATASSPIGSDLVGGGVSGTGAGLDQNAINSGITGATGAANSAASTAGSTAAPGGSGGILDTIKSAIGSTGDKGSGLLGSLKYILPALSIAKSTIGPQYPKGTNQLLTAGGNALNTEQGLINDLQTGNLPPNVQASINQQVKDAQTAIRSKYAQMGMTGSTAETQELSAAVAQGQQAALSYATQATSTGLQALGATDQIYNSIISSILGNNNQLNSALASLGGASTKA